MENPGGSLIISTARKAETEAVYDYSTVIGNDYHLDLLDAEGVVRELNREERLRLLAWCDGLSPREAAQFTGVRPGSLRKSRQRTVSKIVEQMNAQEEPRAGR